MWVIRDAVGAEYQRALEELEKGPDRTVGIVAGAIVDSYLTEALKREFRPDDTIYSAKIQAHVFSTEGPLANFGAKIWVAYLLGYFSQQAHDDLQNFTHIRNRFAHYAEHYSFDTQKIKDRCANFKLVNTHIGHPTALLTTAGQTVAVETLNVLNNKLLLGLRDHQEKLKIPKERFVCTAKLFCAAFALYKHPEGNLKKPIL